MYSNGKLEEKEKTNNIEKEKADNSNGEKSSWQKKRRRKYE